MPDRKTTTTGNLCGQWLEDPQQASSQCRAVLRDQQDEDSTFEHLIRVVSSGLNVTFWGALDDISNRSVAGACCSAARAARHGKEGIAKYRAGEFEAAAAGFTQCLAFTDERCASAAASHACLNRSLCHIRLGCYESTLRDCSLSVALRPSAKGHFRMALALEQLGRRDEAHAAAAEAQSLLSPAHAAWQHAAALVRRLSAKLQQGSSDAHARTAAASEQDRPCLEIRHTPLEGRALQLAADEHEVHRGSLLLREDPAALVPAKPQQSNVRSG